MNSQDPGNQGQQPQDNAHLPGHQDENRPGTTTREPPSEHGVVALGRRLAGGSVGSGRVGGRSGPLPPAHHRRRAVRGRRDALEDIDPSWCPSWDIAWQRCYRLCHNLLEAGAPLPTGPGQMTVQGEDLGKWVQAQRLNWDQLLPAQTWMLENTLDIGPAGPEERPPAQVDNAADGRVQEASPRDASRDANGTLGVWRQALTGARTACTGSTWEGKCRRRRGRCGQRLRRRGHPPRQGW